MVASGGERSEQGCGIWAETGGDLNSHSDGPDLDSGFSPDWLVGTRRRGRDPHLTSLVSDLPSSPTPSEQPATQYQPGLPTNRHGFPPKDTTPGPFLSLKE